MTKITLGTAQFDNTYGLGRQSHNSFKSRVYQILDEACELNVQRIDTAPVYANAEEIIGEMGLNQLSITTKIPRLNGPPNTYHQEITSHIEYSLSRLRQQSISTLLLHHPHQLFDEGSSLWSGLQSLKKVGLVDEIGVSVYSPSEYVHILDKFEFDVVQHPMNAIDGRWNVDGGGVLASAGPRIQIRSIFLQGLLLSKSHMNLSRFRAWKDVLTGWHDWLELHRLTGLKGCVNTVYHNSWVSEVVVGVDLPGQLSQVLESIDRDAVVFPDELKSSDPDLLDPRRWQKDK